MFKFLVFCLTLCPEIYEISCRDENISSTSSQQSNNTDGKNSTVTLGRNYTFHAIDITINSDSHSMHLIDIKSSNSEATVNSNAGANVSSERTIPSDYIEEIGIGAYKYYAEPRTWHEAQKICNDEHADLLVIRSEAEEAIIRKIIRGRSTILPLGIHLHMEKWITVFDEDISDIGWIERQRPQFDGSPKNCGYFVIEESIKRLSNEFCYSVMSFICKISTT